MLSDRERYLILLERVNLISDLFNMYCRDHSIVAYDDTLFEVASSIDEDLCLFYTTLKERMDK